MTTDEVVSAAAELAGFQNSGCTPDRALALFDRLPAADVPEIVTGRWRGSEIDTGHPFDGVLGASGWYGKQFDDAETVHPLLFSDTTGKIFAVDPRRVPLSLTGKVPLSGMRAARKSLRYLGAALRTTRPAARLRSIEYRGVVSAAMVYDHLPIIDHFRRVDADTLFGVMDMRGLREPYFFVLCR
ncbi:DUF4334 domain-containing protein [Nocardia bovistercoris]|uniref:DUF4334 domain-containing protein n=1 Tax=Nocardia bovistercoris TaxID=2785916 RepID=A0A931I4V8_9NOCA|nr:DUF4334 domain-containing protein [Nocardia bovistercoris]MBH0774912.1 DUF4334 domain-containing protein [Nocardia bovistercoris]